MTETIKLNCSICHAPLDDFAAEHNQKYHEDCKNCTYCGHPVHYDIINKLIKDESGHTDYKILIYHQTCRDEQLLNEYKKTPVVITQAHLDALNRAQLMMDQIFKPNLDLSIETNQELVERAIRPWFTELSNDQMYAALMNVQAIASAMSITLGTKGKESARVKLSEREKNKFREVQNYRNKQESDKQTERTNETQKAEKAIQRNEEKANPQLKAERKAIEAIMKILPSLTEQQAREQLGLAKKSQEPVQ